MLVDGALQPVSRIKTSEAEESKKSDILPVNVVPDGSLQLVPIAAPQAVPNESVDVTGTE